MCWRSHPVCDEDCVYVGVWTIENSSNRFLPQDSATGSPGFEKASFTFREVGEGVMFGVEMTERSTCPDQHPHG